MAVVDETLAKLARFLIDVTSLKELRMKAISRLVIRWYLGRKGICVYRIIRTAIPEASGH